ncbi:MAG TPA: type II toxin-antitoxin system VapC family toxin [Ilumatobacter sp.]|nr:type II toxin-antitoxin system VapC family toxin [Ilumatobacter sp.]
MLLDTHALLWWAESESRLGRRAGDSIATASRVVVSDVTLWELAIKVRAGKLNLRPTFDAWVARCRSQPRLAGLPIGLAHIRHTTQLPLHHRDPFDRLLIAQALVEDLTIITVDRMFESYGVSVLAADE